MSDDAAKNFHAGSPSSQAPLYDTDVPTPSHAERARTLVGDGGDGTLSTVLHPESDAPGHPYGSVVAYALHDGRPVILVSALAEHTRNLKADPRCSLLVTEAGAGNPLALGRVTLMGEATALGTDAGDAGAAYLAAHPRAEFYLNFGDFSFWRLDVCTVRYIGGFGRMSWVGVEAWHAAEADPLAAASADIVAHMNDDHADALRDYCLAFTRARDFTAVTMTGVDRYGFEMSVETPDGARPIRLAFDTPVSAPGEVRRAMVDLVARARAALAERASPPGPPGRTKSND